MEIIENQDKTVVKFIHDDLSETCIKTVPSCSSEFRCKYSIFISTSLGCNIGCKFCHLTLKKCKYKKIHAIYILKNIKESLTKMVEINPEIKNMYVKIAWMGMGDPLTDIKKVRQVTLCLAEWIIEKGYAIGIDGVDIATTIPKNVDKFWKSNVSSLNNWMSMFNSNPQNIKRSPVRLFYSLHSFFEENRHNLIPGSMDLDSAMMELESLDIDIVFHYIFFDGVNDRKIDIDSIISFFSTNEYLGQSCQLRILNYNKHEDCDIIESSKKDKIIKKLKSKLTNIKIQESSGSEVESACGQFIVSEEAKIRPSQLKN